VVIRNATSIHSSTINGNNGIIGAGISIHSSGYLLDPARQTG